MVHVGVVGDGQRPAGLASAEGEIVLFAIARPKGLLVEAADGLDEVATDEQTKAVKEGDARVQSCRVGCQERSNVVHAEPRRQRVRGPVAMIFDVGDRLP